MRPTTRPATTETTAPNGGSHLTHDLDQLARRTLTPREYDAWRLSIAGQGRRRTARILGISDTTARDALTRARRKLNEAITHDQQTQALP